MDMQKHELMHTESASGEAPNDGSIASTIDKQKVLRKMDLRLIPIVTVLYLFSFLDRGWVQAVRTV
jgi:hypothetical protein